MNRLDLVKLIAKRVVIEGSKVVAVGAGVTIVTTLAKEGMTGLSDLTVEALLTQTKGAK